MSFKPFLRERLEKWLFGETKRQLKGEITKLKLTVHFLKTQQPSVNELAKNIEEELKDKYPSLMITCEPPEVRCINGDPNQLALFNSLFKVEHCADFVLYRKFRIHAKYVSDVISGGRE